MSANFAFYIHHHGSGHLMRALSIASRLEAAGVTFLGSDLARYAAIIPKGINCVHLPGDVAGPDDCYASMRHLSFLHYAPANVEKVVKRTAEISAALHALFPVILVVDVSVEVTLLATLCGIPAIVIRQNGDRDDDAHLHAYECAQLLIAPSPEQLMNPSPKAWVDKKTFFSGGFSKYSGKDQYKMSAGSEAIGIIVGSGGTSLNGRVVSALATQCRTRHIHVVGEISGIKQASETNVTLHGQINDPVSVLSQCDVVIGNAGHNTVMEMADIGKKFICIPEERPFQEQLRKAELLGKNGMAVLVDPQDLDHLEWETIIRKAEDLPDDCWTGVISESALEDIAVQLHEVWDRNFSQI